MKKSAKLSTLMGKEFTAQHSKDEREEKEGERRTQPGAKKREARGRQIPAPSLPGPPLTTHTEALGTPLQRSGQHSGRPVAFHHDAGNLSQSEMGSVWTANGDMPRPEVVPAGWCFHGRPEGTGG